MSTWVVTGTPGASRCDVVATNDLKAASQLALSRAERALRTTTIAGRSGLLKGNLSDETNFAAPRARIEQKRLGPVNRYGFRDVKTAT